MPACQDANSPGLLWHRVHLTQLAGDLGGHYISAGRWMQALLFVPSCISPCTGLCMGFLVLVCLGCSVFIESPFQALLYIYGWPYAMAFGRGV